MWRAGDLVAEYIAAEFPALISHLVRVLDRPDRTIRMWRSGVPVADLPGDHAPRLIRDLAAGLVESVASVDDPDLPLG